MRTPSPLTLAGRPFSLSYASSIQPFRPINPATPSESRILLTAMTHPSVSRGTSILYNVKTYSPSSTRVASVRSRTQRRLLAATTGDHLRNSATTSGTAASFSGAIICTPPRKKVAFH
jgi:hypothetical protein